MLEAFSTEISKTTSEIRFQTGRACRYCRAERGWRNSAVDGCTTLEEGKPPTTKYRCGAGLHELTLKQLLWCDKYSISRIGTV